MKNATDSAPSQEDEDCWTEIGKSTQNGEDLKNEFRIFSGAEQSTVDKQFFGRALPKLELPWLHYLRLKSFRNKDLFHGGVSSGCTGRAQLLGCTDEKVDNCRSIIPVVLFTNGS